MADNEGASAQADDVPMPDAQPVEEPAAAPAEKDTQNVSARDIFGDSDSDDGVVAPTKSRSVVSDDEDAGEEAVASSRRRQARVEEDSADEDADSSSRRDADRGDDDDEEGEKGGDQEDVGAKDLFGSDDEDDDGDEESRRPSQPVFGPPISLELVSQPRSSDAKIFAVKLPTVLGISSRPYDREKHVEGATTTVKELVENQMRWRNVSSSDGDVVKETNSRFVHWSDGSWTFHVGDVAYDVSEEVMNDQMHVYGAHGTAALEAHGTAARRMVLRPSGPLGQELEIRASQAKNEIAGRAVERTVKMVAVTQNPMERRREQEQQELESLRAKRKLEAMQRSHRERFQLNEAALEEDNDDEEDEDFKESDDEEERNERALLQAKRGPARRSRRIASDEDEEDE